MIEVCDSEGAISTKDVQTDARNITLFDGRVMKVNSHKGLDKRSLHIDEFSISLYSDKFLSKEKILSRRVLMMELTEISLKSANCISFSSNSINIEIQHQASQQMFRVVCLHLNAIRIKDSFSVKFYDGFQMPEQISQQKFSPMQCLRSRIFGNGKNPSVTLLSSFTLVNNANTIDLSQVSDFSSFYDELLLSIPTFSSIVLPRSAPQSSFWPGLSHLMMMPNSIKSIQISEPISKDFHLFTESLSQNQSLKSLAFSESAITPEQSLEIVDLLSSHPLLSLSFGGTLKSEAAKLFLEKIGPTRDQLKSFELDYWSNPDIALIISKLTCLTKLTLQWCDIEISSFLSLLSNLQSCSIAELDLAGNLCKKVAVLQNGIPSSLSVISVSSSFVSFAGLLFLLKVTSSHSSHISLDCSNLRITEYKWDPFFKGLTDIEPQSISSLSWSRNTLNPAFFDFLDRCENLKTLCMDGCFASPDNSLHNLAEFIAFNHSVESLQLRGDDKKRMSQASLQIVISALKENSSIVEIDLSSNAFGDICLSELSKVLISNPWIRALNFSPCGLVYKAGFKRFFEQLSKRGTRLELSWPAEEIEQMKQSNLITESEIDQMVALYRTATDQGLEEGKKNHRTKEGVPSYRIPRMRISEEKGSDFKTLINRDDVKKGECEVVVPEIKGGSSLELLKAMSVRYSLRSILSMER